MSHNTFFIILVTTAILLAPSSTLVQGQNPCPYPATCAKLDGMPGTYIQPGQTYTWPFSMITLLAEAGSIQAASFWMVAIGLDRFKDQCINSDQDQVGINVQLAIMESSCYPNCTRPIYKSNYQMSHGGEHWAQWAIMATNPNPGVDLTVSMTNYNNMRDGSGCSISLGGVNGVLGYIEYVQEPIPVVKGKVVKTVKNVTRGDDDDEGKGRKKKKIVLN